MFCSIRDLSKDLQKDFQKKFYSNINKLILDYYISLNIINSKYKLNNVNTINFINLVPIPSYFNTYHTNNNIIRNGNMYIINNTSTHTILHANIMLPDASYSSIPFTFPYIYHDMIELVDSNVYYYEIIITDIIVKKSWNDMNVSIGFGTNSTDLSCNLLGWTNNSIGYHSFDGHISCWMQKDKIGQMYGVGDTVGAGIIYEINNMCTIFFTLNGIIIEKFIVQNKVPFIPMIGINYNTMIEVNFSIKPFKYNFKQHIKPFIISVNNIFIKRNFDDIKWRVNTRG